MKLLQENVVYILLQKSYLLYGYRYLTWLLTTSLLIIVWFLLHSHEYGHGYLFSISIECCATKKKFVLEFVQLLFKILMKFLNYNINFLLTNSSYYKFRLRIYNFYTVIVLCIIRRMTHDHSNDLKRHFFYVSFTYFRIYHFTAFF